MSTPTISALPVTREEFIDHARLNGITVDAQPDLIDRELKAATARAQRFLRRSILTQDVSAVFVADGKDCACGQMLTLPRGNVQAITKVVQSAGGSQPLEIPPSGYVLAGNVITLNAPAYGPVTVEWKSGYGDDAAAVPDSVREGILEYATTLYEDRRGARESRYVGGGDGLPKGIRDLWRSEQLEI